MALKARIGNVIPRLRKCFIKRTLIAKDDDVIYDFARRYIERSFFIGARVDCFVIFQ